MKVDIEAHKKLGKGLKKSRPKIFNLNWQLFNSVLYLEIQELQMKLSATQSSLVGIKKTLIRTLTISVLLIISYKRLLVKKVDAEAYTKLGKGLKQSWLKEI